ncbi:MAG: SIR2 family protein [Candidatus Cloacimonadales bacterium]|nr:SIR2 family protein [Candidatus Cloacimonadales bacterium]
MNNLVPLSANLITRNRNYVLFVGAGLSKDAGVKIGWDILIETLQPIYLAEEEITELPANYKKDIEKWYLEHETYNKFGYSEILELVHKGEIERRDYLEKFFKNEVPGEAHKQIAQMVANGLIRFIFTTNIDNLIEKALDEMNLDFDVIFSDEILEKTKSWDKVRTCRVYKLHGDYKTGKIRNTVKELETLDPLIADDFQYIIDRHGLIVIGYAGRDKAIMAHFKLRKPFAYPFYWQYRSFPQVIDEYSLFHELKDKYENDYESPIIYIENPSASDILSKINNGVHNLEVTIISNDSDLKKFRDYIINRDSKKIRALSLDLIHDFQDLYKTADEKRKLNSNFIHQYNIFSEFINSQSKILIYIDKLFEFSLINEANFAIDKIHKIVLDFIPENYDFFGKPILYYYIMTLGSICLKYNHNENYYSKISLFKYRSHDYIKCNVVTDISYIEQGWLDVEEQEFNINYINAKFSIIEEHLLPESITSNEFIQFDAYLTISWLLSDNNDDAWICGSAIHVKEFMDFFIDNFDQSFTKESAELIIKRINTKYHGFRDRGIRGLNTLIFYLKKKYDLQ